MSMQYSTQAIVCLANDLRATAEAFQRKREIEGDLRKTINRVEQTAATVHYYPDVIGLPNLFSGRPDGSGGSRLIIVGHGNPESTHIIGDGVQWTAEELNTHVEGWLNGSVINRISLHMCFGGGNPTGRLAPMPVAPENSFAMAFARICQVARSVTARTEVVNILTRTNPAGAVTDVQRTVADRHQQPGDKYVFEPRGQGRVAFGPVR
jgi:hypothetical protein